MEIVNINSELMEKWNAYDKNGKLIDKILIRGENIPSGMYHLVCEVIVKHKDGTYLCMQRSYNKKGYPGYYEVSAGGAALIGEDKFTCIKRELKEETGLICDEFTQIGFMIEEDAKCLFYSFLCVVDCGKDSIILQEGETINYKWINEKELIDFINSNQMMDRQKRRYFAYFKKEGFIK